MSDYLDDEEDFNDEPEPGVVIEFDEEGNEYEVTFDDWDEMLGLVDDDDYDEDYEEMMEFLEGDCDIDTYNRFDNTPEYEGNNPEVLINHEWPDAFNPDEWQYPYICYEFPILYLLARSTAHVLSTLYGGSIIGAIYAKYIFDFSKWSAGTVGNMVKNVVIDLPSFAAGKAYEFGYVCFDYLYVPEDLTFVEKVQTVHKWIKDEIDLL